MLFVILIVKSANPLVKVVANLFVKKSVKDVKDRLVNLVNLLVKFLVKDVRDVRVVTAQVVPLPYKSNKKEET